MQPEQSDAAYRWDMLQAAREVREFVVSQRNVLAHDYADIEQQLL